MRIRGLGVAAALAGLVGPVSAQDFTAEVRPRFEVRAFDGDTDSFTAMRTRFGVAWAFDTPGTLFIQVQDVRRWGTDPGDASAEVFDLHQGWLELGARGESNFWLRAGRQEMSLGTRRLVAAPPWSHASRSFDAARMALRIGSRALLEGFSAILPDDASFSGLWLEGSGGPLDRGAAFAFFEYDNRMGTADRTTVGAEALLALGPFDLQLEGSIQETEGVGEGAAFGAFRLTLPLDRPGAQVSAGVDVLSGAAPGDDRRPFDNLYGLAHSFHGFADLFTDFTVHTGGRGLVDWTARGVWPAGDAWSVQIDLHRFSVAVDEGLPDAHLADEVDLTARWRSDDGLAFLGGLAFVSDDDALAAVGRPGLGQVFGYVQLGVALDGR